MASILVHIDDATSAIDESIRVTLASHQTISDRLIAELRETVVLALVKIARQTDSSHGWPSIAEGAAAAKRTEEIASWIERNAGALPDPHVGDMIARAIRRGDFKYKPESKP